MFEAYVYKYKDINTKNKAETEIIWRLEVDTDNPKDAMNKAVELACKHQSELWMRGEWQKVIHDDFYEIRGVFDDLVLVCRRMSEIERLISKRLTYEFMS